LHLFPFKPFAIQGRFICLQYQCGRGYFMFGLHQDEMPVQIGFNLPEFLTQFFVVGIISGNRFGFRIPMVRVYVNTGRNFVAQPTKIGP
jgi:hypothetical protein